MSNITTVICLMNAADGTIAFDRYKNNAIYWFYRKNLVFSKVYLLESIPKFRFQMRLITKKNRIKIVHVSSLIGQTQHDSKTTIQREQILCNRASLWR